MADSSPTLPKKLDNILESNPNIKYVFNCISKAELETNVERNKSRLTAAQKLFSITVETPNFKEMLEKAITQAYNTVNDRKYNPIRTFSDYVWFIRHTENALPSQICNYNNTIAGIPPRYNTLYDKINQGMGLLYYIADQSLPEIDKYSYYHNSLYYSTPLMKVIDTVIINNGKYLDSEKSLKDMQLSDKEIKNFHMDQYEDASNWHSFNDFFNRRLKSLDLRPIKSPNDNKVIIAPADSEPFGTWKISDDGIIIVNNDDYINRKLNIKTRSYTNITSLLGFSEYSRHFYGGTITHMMLDIHDYHRYHFPISGEILEKRIIPGCYGPGGVIYWDNAHKEFCEEFSNTLSWQAIETRGLIILETEYGKVAIMPTGMCQVASINLDGAKVGKYVTKGDELGYFSFGGSDIVMIFEKKMNFVKTTNSKHILMGQEYGRLEI